MVISYTVLGKVKFMMKDFIQGLLDECLGALMQGASMTPAANHLFNVNPDCNKLGEEKVSQFHHLTAKLLYMSKCACPDLKTAVLALAMQVQEPDKDDNKKLSRCIRYLRDNMDIPLTLEINDSGTPWVSHGCANSLKSNTR